MFSGALAARMRRYHDPTAMQQYVPLVWGTTTPCVFCRSIDAYMAAFDTKIAEEIAKKNDAQTDADGFTLVTG